MADLPGPHHLVGILRKKAEVSRVLTAFHAMGQTDGCHSTTRSSLSVDSGDSSSAIAVQRTEDQYFEMLSDIYRLRQAGGIFPCSFRAAQMVERDAIVVTRQGRFIMTQGQDLSVILPDELFSLTNKAAKFRRGGFQRREADHSYAFLISWSRVRPDQAPIQTRTQVFMEEHGAEFEAVTRQVLGRRRQAKWRQLHALSKRFEDLKTPFNAQAGAHSNALYSLWIICFPGIPPPSISDGAVSTPGSKSPPQTSFEEDCASIAQTHELDGLNPDTCCEGHPRVAQQHLVEDRSSWTSLGFPSEAPLSLVASTGVLGIKQMLAYAEEKAHRVREILDHGLEFAIISIRVTQMLAHIGFDSGRHTEPLPIAKPEEGPSPLPLARLLHNITDPTALEQVHWLLVDTVVDMLQRNHVVGLSDIMLQVQRSLLRCLDKLPTSIEELAVMMQARHHGLADCEVAMDPSDIACV